MEKNDLSYFRDDSLEIMGLSRYSWRRTLEFVVAHEYVFQGPRRGLNLRDGKNGDRPGYVHENTGHDDKMSC